MAAAQSMGISQLDNKFTGEKDMANNEISVCSQRDEYDDGFEPNGMGLCQPTIPFYMLNEPFESFEFVPNSL